MNSFYITGPSNFSNTNLLTQVLRQNVKKNSTLLIDNSDNDFQRTSIDAAENLGLSVKKIDNRLEGITHDHLILCSNLKNEITDFILENQSEHKLQVYHFTKRKYLNTLEPSSLKDTSNFQHRYKSGNKSKNNPQPKTIKGYHPPKGYHNILIALPKDFDNYAHFEKSLSQFITKHNIQSAQLLPTASKTSNEFSNRYSQEHNITSFQIPVNWKNKNNPAGQQIDTALKNAQSSFTYWDRSNTRILNIISQSFDKKLVNQTIDTTSLENLTQKQINNLAEDNEMLQLHAPKFYKGEINTVSFNKEQEHCYVELQVEHSQIRPIIKQYDKSYIYERPSESENYSTLKEEYDQDPNFNLIKEYYQAYQDVYDIKTINYHKNETPTVFDLAEKEATQIKDHSSPYRQQSDYTTSKHTYGMILKGDEGKRFFNQFTKGQSPSTMLVKGQLKRDTTENTLYESRNTKQFLYNTQRILFQPTNDEYIIQSIKNNGKSTKINLIPAIVGDKRSYSTTIYKSIEIVKKQFSFGDTLTIKGEKLLFKKSVYIRPENLTLKTRAKKKSLDR